MCGLRRKDSLIRRSGSFLVRHVEGWWNLPGGFIEPGETPAEAARRETREGASVEIDLLRIGGVFGGPDVHSIYPNGDEVAWALIVFEARIASGIAQPGDGETAEVRWETIGDALAIELTDPWRHILSSFRDGRRFDDVSA